MGLSFDSADMGKPSQQARRADDKTAQGRSPAHTPSARQFDSAEAQRRYEELMEDEYAKREGGA